MAWKSKELCFNSRQGWQFLFPKTVQTSTGHIIFPIQGRREYSGCSVKLSTHIHHEWSSNSTALHVVTACIQTALPLLYLSLRSYKNKLQMMQCASNLVYHHETCRNKKTYDAVRKIVIQSFLLKPWPLISQCCRTSCFLLISNECCR